MSASGESSTTMHRLLHASGSHPIPTPYDPKTGNVAADCTKHKKDDKKTSDRRQALRGYGLKYPRITGSINQLFDCVLVDGLDEVSEWTKRTRKPAPRREDRIGEIRSSWMLLSELDDGEDEDLSVMNKPARSSSRADNKRKLEELLKRSCQQEQSR
ncbi:hypothetical protein F511_23897 [Dorcoceras hygrometricum]|uniref:Uncharacterized protein n=1 Tax=Dorcoceras hygrometricum TaxID=472368 RepID=A0A2Z7D4A7_9LAMI|nr:hypothetical protein F511_23897 [Dorcoceras hygrometricum]